MLAVILIAVSLSIDALGIGLTYGMREIIVNIIPKLIISFMSAVITFLSLTVGWQLQKFLPDSSTKIIGAGILFFMGIYLVWQSFKSDENNEPAQKKQSVYEIFIKSLGLTIKIIHAPEFADINGSKKIELGEAFFIGLALSIDSIGSGIGLSMLGYNSFYLPVAVAICQFIFLSLGIFCGNKISKINIDSRKFILLSGLILISIAIIRCA